jgi:hypothetical protein
MVYRSPYPWYFDPLHFLFLNSESSKTPLKYIPLPMMYSTPYLWFIEPLPMELRTPTYGIANPYPWYFEPPTHVVLILYP